ncbi:GAF domain-like protein, partial [Dimargaris cristalligena]
KYEFYEQLVAQAAATLDGHRNWVSNLATISSMLHHSYRDSDDEKLQAVNWTGFYLTDRQSNSPNKLTLGPYQGKASLCGVAVNQRLPQVVGDVSTRDAYITCDPNTASEIVVPLIANGGKILGVLNVDSTKKFAFNEEDKIGLEALAQMVVDASDW